MDLTAPASAFQIKPDLENVLQSSSVKQLIQEIVGELLLNETYSTEKVKNWCVKIADQVNLRLRDLSKQKYLIQVVILQKLGQGFKLTARCRWDSDCDSMITDSFTNESLICIVTVFSVYKY